MNYINKIKWLVAAYIGFKHNEFADQIAKYATVSPVIQSINLNKSDIASFITLYFVNRNFQVFQKKSEVPKY